MDAWIEEAHRRATWTRNEGVRRTAANRDTAADWERQQEEWADLVDFYRWLRRHVDDGVFYVKDCI